MIWTCVGLLVLDIHFVYANTLKGRVIGYEKLESTYYKKMAQPENHGYIWRAPSLTVRRPFRILSGPSSMMCIAVFSDSSPQPLVSPVPIILKGGRATPSTVVIRSGTPLLFQNRDLIAHGLIKSGGREILPALPPDHEQVWISPDQHGIFDLYDECTPSVRIYLHVVKSPSLYTTYPDAKGAFALELPEGNYIVHAFFEHVEPITPFSVVIPKNRNVDLPNPLHVEEGGM
ncbi:hypothetical protein [Pajaroellobacter abortibovis]|uniref:Rhamnogalacturonan lyase domain-containing protein n=1 Tax=Pajaroellobacter abortibovis TaxID=1882918 RepID=A0A1L6MWP1_9BACT|nr:hypothetical protein [Pajaroellobacter abortibovis]APR99855.1 hypothetical protein BCY86_03565 [Pajaroellobacter abortibovis]